MKSLKLGILGLGKMGEAMLIGLQKTVKNKPKSPEYEIFASVRTQPGAEEIQRKHSVFCTTSNRELAEKITDSHALCKTSPTSKRD